MAVKIHTLFSFCLIKHLRKESLQNMMYPILVLTLALASIFDSPMELLTSRIKLSIAGVPFNPSLFLLPFLPSIAQLKSTPWPAAKRNTSLRPTQACAPMLNTYGDGKFFMMAFFPVVKWALIPCSSVGIGDLSVLTCSWTLQSFNSSMLYLIK